MTPELLALIAFIGSLFFIEGWYVARNEDTISKRVQDLTARTPKQIIAGIFILLGTIIGWFVAHFVQ